VRDAGRPSAGQTRWATIGCRRRPAAYHGLLLFRTGWRHNWAMDPYPGSKGGWAVSSPHPADAEAQLAGKVMLAEYAALLAEGERRANAQWNLFALQITSAGVIASLAISHVSDIALLLVIPLLSYMLGSRYILHDRFIKLISRYISDSLSGRLHGHLEWESWKNDAIDLDMQWKRWLTPTGWHLLHPTRLAFEGVAGLALLTAALAAAYTWRDKSPGWGLILGFALLWILGALATYVLDRSFHRSHA